jgi:tetratricopeptide (TPR) repeat protein
MESDGAWAKQLTRWKIRKTAYLIIALLAASQARAQFDKWEATGILGVLPPATHDKSPVVAQIRGDLSELQLSKAQQLAAWLVQKEPRNYEGYFWAGFIEFQQKRLYPAVRYLRQAEKLQPDGNAVQKLLSLVYLELRQYELFELKITEAMKLEPPDFSPHYSLGRYLQSQKEKPELAAEQYRLVLERKPDHYEALYYLGLAYETLGDEPQARSLYQKALAVASRKGRPFSLPYQGLSRLERADNQLRKALDLAKQAVSLEPQLPDNQLELARVYDGLGQFSDAVTALKTSIALDPTQGAVYYRLFSLYRRLDDAKSADDARSGFQRATACYGNE